MKLKKHFLVDLTLKGKGAIIFLCLLVSTFYPVEAVAQENYDEVPVQLHAQGIGVAEIQAAFLNEEVYLSVSDLFDFLKIKNTTSPGLDSISGFFINEKATYGIYNNQNQIFYQGKVHALSPADLIQSETDLYLKINRFGEIFGLNCTFHFRSLAVILKTDLDLPVIREKRQEQMRLNLKRLRGEITADTTIARKNPFFRLGMADWSVNSTQTLDLQQNTESKQHHSLTRGMLSLGANVAGGEANLRLNYVEGMPFNRRNQHYQWRYVNNENPVLRQVTVGRISGQSTSSIFAPVNGVQFTNTATVTRQSFGTYRLSDIAEPNWIVELYINNILVDYVRADNNGFFVFDVPLVYGNSAVRLQQYGPWGEQRVIERNFIIPFNFVPAGELEYNVSGGILEDHTNSRFFRSSVNYGVSRNLTVGGGMEYLSSLTVNPFMPFLNTSVSVAPGLVLTGEYTQHVRSKGVLRYQRPSSLNLEISYTRHEEEQEAIFNNFLEERRLVVSQPIRINGTRLFSQIAVSQLIHPNSKNTRAEFRLSGSLLGMSANITNFAIMEGSSDPYFFSNIALTKRLPARFNLLMQAQYDYNRTQFMTVRGGVEKRMSTKAFLNVAYQNNLLANTKSVEVGFRYNFAFTQAGMTGWFSDNRVMLAQNASGAIMFDQNAGSLKANERGGIGKGGLTILSFLDLNNNGKYDAGEPKVGNVTPRISGGSLEYNRADTTYSVSGLEPYTNVIVEVNESSFQTISWQIKNKVIKVAVEPNHFKLVEIPVSVVGEVAGMIYNYSNPKVNGRIKINFYRDGNVLVGSTITEDDGYFSFLGLVPGTYTAKVDAAQLSKIKMVTLQEAESFTIKSSTEGDIVDDLEIFIGRKE